MIWRSLYYCPEVWEHLRAAHQRAGTDPRRHDVAYELLTDQEREQLNSQAGALDCQGHTVLTFFRARGAHRFEHEAHDHLRHCQLCGKPLVKADESVWPS